jgi:hypothetical protein
MQAIAPRTPHPKFSGEAPVLLERRRDRTSRRDSLALRQFCRVSSQPAPDKTTPLLWAHSIRAETAAAQRLYGGLDTVSGARRGHNLEVGSIMVDMS